MQLNVVSLSYRGGGPAFTQLLIEQLSILEPIYFLAKDSELKEDFPNPLLLDAPHTLLSHSWLKFFTKTICLFYKKLNKDSVVLFTMPHPLDYFFFLICWLRGSKIVIVIHDFRSHVGEKWPTKFALVVRSKMANRVLFLSSYVASHFTPKQKAKFSVCEFPIKKVPSQDPEKYILFAGRMKKYQNLDLILEAWKYAAVKLPHYQLILAGEIKQEVEEHRVKVFRRWLTPRELDTLIMKSAVVVLPYIEASQSGVFMQAAGFGIPIAATPVGGLPEQCRNYPGSALAKSTSAIDFAEAIVQALSLSRGQEYSSSHYSILEALRESYPLK